MFRSAGARPKPWPAGCRSALQLAGPLAAQPAHAGAGARQALSRIQCPPRRRPCCLRGLCTGFSWIISAGGGRHHHKVAALSGNAIGARSDIHGPVPDVLILFGVFAGTEIAGIPGAFLSVPVLELLRIV